MATKRRKHHRLWPWFVTVVVLVGSFFGYRFFTQETDDPSSQTGSQVVSGDEVSFHFIDVGQGDAALICTKEGNILIDAGKNSAEDDLRAYLDQLGIRNIDYAIFTHPHEDHIGGADMVIERYHVRHAILPDCTHTSKTFERMMDALEKEKTEVIEAKPDVTFTVGGVTCTILGPIGTDYASLNDYSVIMKAEYGDTSVLYTGDAEALSEKEQLDRYGHADRGPLDCDLLKVGHHGSDTSSTEAYLHAVSPDFAVISAGEGNSYGHPHAVILERLNRLNTRVYRTDLDGTVVFTSVGGEPVPQK